jgi:hypothetical protein
MRLKDSFSLGSLAVWGSVLLLAMATIGLG